MRRREREKQEQNKMFWTEPSEVRGNRDCFDEVLGFHISFLSTQQKRRKERRTDSKMLVAVFFLQSGKLGCGNFHPLWPPSCISVRRHYTYCTRKRSTRLHKSCATEKGGEKKARGLSRIRLLFFCQSSKRRARVKTCM